MIARWNGMIGQGDEVKDILRSIVIAEVENVGPLLISRAEKALEAMENMNMDTVSVLREPTEAMVSAAINVFAKHPRTREQMARFRDTVRNAIKAALSTAPASPVVGEDAVRNAHVGVLKYWKNELAQTHTPLMATAEPTSIGYIAWFIESAIDIAPSLPLTKLARWVGFIQGILASHNYLNVNSERDRTRPIFECERREASIPAPTAGRAEGLEEAAKPFVKYADVLRGQRSQHNTPIVELWDHKLTGQDFINLADALAHQAVTVDDGDLALIWGRHEMRKAFTTRGRMVGQMLTMHDDIETLLAAFPQRREDDAPRYSYARSSGVWAVWDRSTTTCIKQCADENEAEKLCNKLNAQRREE